MLLKTGRHSYTKVGNNIATFSRQQNADLHNKGYSNTGLGAIEEGS